MKDFNENINAFVDAFNRNDLDAVMPHFAEHAVYLPGDGSEHRGRSAIRAAFEPQFAGAYGAMRFDEHDRVVDSAARKMAIRWTCRHDVSIGADTSMRRRIQRAVIGLIAGRRFGWEGLDVFHFNEAGLICGKFTYANYSFPLVRRSLR